MEDLDTVLARLQRLPLDPRLGGIDDAVLAGLAARGRSPVSGSTIALVAAVSLGIGVAGSLPPMAAPASAASVFPLGAPAALAPSTLLRTGE